MSESVCILTRVSKSSQSYERQILDLSNYCSRNNYTIAKIFNEKISGRSKNEHRSSWLELIEFLDKNKTVSKVLIWELTRLGRTPLETLKAIEELNNRNVSLYIYNYQIETLTPAGAKNPVSQLLITILSEFARTELEMIEQRLASGYKKYRASGGKVGRKKGVFSTKEQLIEKHSDVVKLLKKNRSIREVAKLTNKSNTTVHKIKKLLEQH